MRHTASVTFLILLAFAAAGCGKKNKGAVDDTPQPAQTPRPAPTPTPVPRQEVPPEPFPTEKPTVTEEKLSAQAYNDQGVLKTVYFAFDSSELSPEARATLSANSSWLKSHPDFTVVVEGHCDDRGTIEYNIALGERRASAVREYLATLGVPVNRVRIVSYGEERPAQTGQGEAVWSKNRRGEFELE